MKILLFGGRGMAGHMIVDYFKENSDYVIMSTVRKESEKSNNKIVIDVANVKKVEHLLEFFQPDIVINAVGILNEFATNNISEAIYINSLFPHLLEKYSFQYGYKLIHISTDCVFSGEKGEYTEKDFSDGKSVYARTKILGEITGNPHVTIRTSIIGPELKSNGIGLFHWFMTQNNQQVKGYQRVFWSGVTTLELAKVVMWVLDKPISGLFHLTSPIKISKFDLLTLIKSVFKKDVDIVPYDGIISDKSLIQTRKDIAYKVPNYSDMIKELREWIVKNKRMYQYTDDLMF